MYKQMLQTWIFCILVCVIIPSRSVCAPSENKTTQNTLYEAVVSKCPSLGVTDLYKNWKDLFDNQCSNFTAINATTELTKKELPYVRCKVLYESIMEFCSSNLESLEVVKLKGFISLSNDMKCDLSEVCNDETGLPALESTPNNVSHLMKKFNCVLICSIVGSNGPEVTDICKLAYFFKSIDVKELNSNRMQLHGNIRSSPAPQHKNETLPGPIKVIAFKPLNQSVRGPVDSEIPKLPEANKDNVVKAQESPIVNKSNIDVKPVPKPEENAPAVQPQLIVPNSLENAADDENQNVKSEDNSVGDPGEQNMNIQNNDVGVAVDVSDEVAPGDSDTKDDDKDQGEQPDENGFPAESDVDLGKAKSTLKQSSTISSKGKPNTLDDELIINMNPVEDGMDGDSYFFSYFSVTMCLVIVGYVGYHNRHKILALLLEGKRGKRNGRSGRRPNSANYHKLDTNLEEAISSSCTKNPPSNIIY
ncbi:uncharacterized protein LOC125504371 [Dendroctonus ponderosae]|uniref:Uncharacterized protein n=1 Tax=Dendroctonus ponderosae TaxID=77166 RepID=U4U819_DENPD|nr:uncharacterized protein LOC109546167 [Dendroctonus ponderosae]XP_048522194.1 uncharacterized protein LOC125504371 [Dendroctonus ponderosae]ERL83505.1 hypothetical protein D910_00536 [Dendroctonus ponderosae]ERL90054.1 hypothetical protein D910_07410 [Dendroctonus ponderosae]KAH0998828.1 hypothetical protein HUJ05_010913 [Dendroctonus ponderosae]KAH0998829.1 hypothetical protein HUJ05_010913 [Dendroctonus ponderosae]KAH0998830.1 hypothetical protein HUJ05_010913 [Dendroctonus ponderosae]